MQVRNLKEMEKRSEDEFRSKTLRLRIDTGLQQIEAWKSRLALWEQYNTQLGYVYATSGRDKSAENWDGCIDWAILSGLELAGQDLRNRVCRMASLPVI
jgi:hypothetical protein